MEAIVEPTPRPRRQLRQPLSALQRGTQYLTNVMPRVPVSRQPGHIAPVDRVDRPVHPVPPAHRRTALSDRRSKRPLTPRQLTSPRTVGEHSLAISQPEHQLRSMPPHPTRHMPPQFKRLAGQAGYAPVAVEEHHVQSHRCGPVVHKFSCGGRPPPRGQPLAFAGWERLQRRTAFERHLGSGRQPPRALHRPTSSLEQHIPRINFGLPCPRSVPPSTLHTELNGLSAHPVMGTRGPIGECQLRPECSAAQV
jgi:hypothetical protein